MANMLISPLFWGIFFFFFGGLLGLSHVKKNLHRVTDAYQSWLKLPLRAPLIIFLLHLAVSLLAGWLCLRSFGVLGGFAVPLAFYAGRALLEARFRDNIQAYKVQLPDILDLIALCLSTGLSLQFALQRLLPLIKKNSPLWAEALEGVLAELEMGVPLERAFANLVEHVPLPALKRVSNMVGHAQNYGTQLVPLFRQMAQDMRDERLSLVEIKAQKLPVYLSIVLVVFFLPSLLLVTLAPLLIRLTESLSLAFS